MFSSKPLHKNVSLFTANGISTGIGDPYMKKSKSSSVAAKAKGKQFQVGRASKDYFGELQPLSQVPGNGAYKSDLYEGSRTKKKPSGKQLSQDAGFGSKDSRGIQTTDMESRMYSEKLYQEKRAVRNAGRSIVAKLDLPTGAACSAATSRGAITLFDRCNAGEDDESLRLKPGTGANKRIGSMVTSANTYGANVADAPARGAQFSRVAVTREFYNSQTLETASSGDYLNM